MDFMVPLIYNDTTYKKQILTFPSGHGPTLVTTGLNRFGLGDIEIEPLLLSWHLEHFDFTAGYGFWAPTGDYHDFTPVNFGDGLWTQMIKLGGVWYLDHDKTWAFSILNHFECNSQAPGTHLVPEQPFQPAAAGVPPREKYPRPRISLARLTRWNGERAKRFIKGPTLVLSDTSRNSSCTRHLRRSTIPRSPPLDRKLARNFRIWDCRFRCGTNISFWQTMLLKGK
jgi:hypothetical protein